MKSKRVNFFRNTQRLIFLSLAILPFFTSLDAVEIAAGNGSALYISDDGDLFGWGANTTGQLGDGTIVDRDLPVTSVESGPWAQVATSLIATSSGSSDGHSLGIKADGTLWTWGNNNQGQLGLGDTTTRLVPTQVGSANNWVAVEAGAAFSMALNSSGEIWVWGANNFGQLGGSVSSSLQTTPVQLKDKDGTSSNNDKWIAIAAGADYALAIHEFGSGATFGYIYGWGRNSTYQLGLGHTSGVSGPTKVGTKSWTKVEAGTTSSFAIDNSFYLYAWGQGAFGGLGTGPDSGTSIQTKSSPTIVSNSLSSATRYLDVSAGASHTLALSTSYQLFFTGQNSSGQSGIANGQALYNSFQIVRANVANISAGRDFSAIELADGSFLTAGSNSSGQLGAGSGDSSSTFGSTALGAVDLAVDSIEILSDVTNVAPSSSIDIRIVIQNNGTGTIEAADVAAMKLNLALSPVTTFGATGQVEFTEGLSFSVPASAAQAIVATSSLTIDLVATLPAAINAGDYNLLVDLDSDDTIEEFNEDNNTGSTVAADAVTFTLDLVPVVGSPSIVSAQASYDVGDDFTLAFEIRNDGTGELAKNQNVPFKLKFLLTPDYDDLSEDTAIELTPNVGASALALDIDLSAGGSYADSLTFSIPEEVDAVAYYLVVVLDDTDVLAEADEDNNTRISSTKLISVAELSLSEGLDFFGTTFTTTGSGAWYGFDFNGAEDGDAAFSPRLFSGQEAGFRTSLITASVVRFDWRAATAGGANVLTLNAGTTELSISGETSWESVQFAVPSNTSIVWTYSAGADQPNSRVYVDNFSVEAMTRPDLIIPGLQLLDNGTTVVDSVSLVAGQDSLYYGLQITNQGADLNSDLPDVDQPFKVALYLSRDSNFDPTEDIEIQTVVYSRDMESGSSGSISREVAPLISGSSGIPLNASGDYYLIAVADVDDDVANETGVLGFSDGAGAQVQANNIYVTESAAINIRQLPDLTVTAIDVDGWPSDNVILAGGFSVDYVLHNIGLGDAYGQTQVSIVFSEDDVYDAGSDIVVAYSSLFGGLAAGDSNSTFIPIYSLPAGLPIGDFRYLGIAVDTGNAFSETDETNNFAFFENPVYAFGYASLENSLEASSSEISYTISTDYSAPFSSGFPFFGQQDESYDDIDAARSAVISDGEKSYFEVEVSVPAGEDAMATFAWKVSSEDNGSGKSDDFVLYLDGEQKASIAGEQDWTEAFLLLPGRAAPYTLRWSYEKDASISAGSDFAWIDQLQIELLANPDFRPFGIALTDEGGSEVDSGSYRIGQDSISLNYNFENIGKNYAGAEALELEFYLSEDRELDSEDTALGSLASAPLGMIALNSGRSVSGTANFNSVGLSSGHYYLIALADPQDLVQERGETAAPGDDLGGNNLYVSTTRIVTLVDEPDLIVSYEEPNVPTGGLLLLEDALGEISLLVENQGGAAVSATRSIAFLLQDALGLEADTTLREFSSTEVLSGALGTTPNYTFTRTFDAVGENALTGLRYNLIAFVDSKDQILESDETNNLTALSDGVSPYVFADLALWEALNPELLNPSMTPVGFSGSDSIALVNDETAPFESDLPFVGLEDATSESGDLGRSIVLDDGEAAAFSIELNLDADAALVFTWKSDDTSTTENTEDLYGDFKFSLDASPIDSIAPLEVEADWSEEVVPLDAGLHTLTWRFTRDAEVPESALDVFAYVDSIRFLPDLEIDLDDASVSDLTGVSLVGQTLSPESEFQFEVEIRNTSLGAVPSDSEYNVEARLSSDEVWGNEDDYLLLITATGIIPNLDGNADSGSINFTTSIPEETPLGDYYLLVRVDPDTVVLEVDENNNDDRSDLKLITIDAITLEDGLDIEAIDDPSDPDDSTGFGAGYFKSVFPLISGDTMKQTIDLSWADSPDIEVVETSRKWFATGGVTGATSPDVDAIKTSALEAGVAASLLFRLDQPRLIRFKVQPNSGGSSNYLFFGENGNELRPEGGLVSRISGTSADWETRYYVAPSEAPIGFTYVQGATPGGEEFVYVDELIIGDPLDKPDYVIDTLQYEAGSYVLQRDRLFVTVTGNNRGVDYEGPLPDDFRVRVWLSSDDTKSNDDFEIGVLEDFQSVAGGTRFAYQASLILPDNLPEGNYHLIARVDADNVITEFAVDASASDFANAVIVEDDADAFTANDNNFLVSSDSDIFIDRRADLRVVPSEDSVYNELLLAGPAQQSSDEVVDFFIIEPTTGEGPSELLIKFDLLNEGLSGVSASEADDFTIDVYVATSRDEEPSAERLISSFVIENGIAAGTRYTFEETTAIPDNIEAGVFYYINVVVDGSGTIDESDEEDNSTYSAHGSIFVSDVSLEVALNDEDYGEADAPLYVWDKSFLVPSQNDSTRQAPFFGTKEIFGQDNSDSGVRASAQSGPVLTGGESWLQQTVVVADGSEVQVSFMWKVSSQFEVTETGVFEDILAFSIRYEGDEDFTLIAYISGERDWAEFIQSISVPGAHTLRWSYVENGDGERAGADAGWIDDYSEASYDFVPTFVTPSNSGPYVAGDTITLPVFIWNLGELSIPDSGIGTTVRLAKKTGDTSNLDWSVANASDVTLHAVAYDALLLENLIYLRDNLDSLALPAILSSSDLDTLMDAAFIELLESEAGEIDPELTEVEIAGLQEVLTTNGQTWRDYSDEDLELLLAIDETNAEQASRKRFLPVRTYAGANDISIPNLLSESGSYYLGVWVNYAEQTSESNFTNNLLYSSGLAVSLDVANTIPEVIEQAGLGDNNLNLLDDAEEWTLSGQGRWYPVGDADEAFAPDALNDTSLRSPSEGMVQDGEASISALVEGPKLIRFNWRGEFGNSPDVVSFYVNDVAVAREYGGVGSGTMTLTSEDDGAWIEEQYLLPEGLNEIRWTFTRVDDGQDQGVVYLDDLSFEDVTDRVDLAVSSVNYTGGSYALERDGFPLTVNVLNRGSMPSGFDYNDLDLEVRLGLSQDFDTASQIVGHLAVIDVLDEGQRLIFQGDIDLPVNLAEGSYYLLVRVKSLDPDFEEFTYDTGVELLENNDYASSLQNVNVQHLPQLVVQATDVENEKVFYPKESIRFDWELQNIGLGDIPYGTELTQTIELWSIDANEVNPSLEDAEKVLDIGSVTEVTALPGRLTADNTSQSTIAYKQVYRLPSQAELLGALGVVDAGLEDLDAEVISNLAELEKYQFFLVLTRDQSIDQSSNLNVTAVTNELFRVSAFPYDEIDPALDADASLDYSLWHSFQDGRIPVGAIAPSSGRFDTLGGGDYEQLYYYGFNLPLLTDLSIASPDLTRVNDVTSYSRTRTVEDGSNSYRAITFNLVRGASDLVYRVQRNNGAGWVTWLDVEPPYLDSLYGLTAGYVGSRTLSDVNASDGIDSLLELSDFVVSAVDNNYTASVTVRADDAISDMRVVILPLGEDPLEQFVIDYFTGNNEYNYQLMEPLEDYDDDGSSNIAELQLGRDPISDTDVGTTTALEDFIAETFAVDYGLYDPMPANIAPFDDYDSDGSSNIAELQLGRDPSSNADVGTTTALEDFVAEAFAVNYGLYDPMPADLAPLDDYDSDGASNIAELQLGRNLSSDADFATTTSLEGFVAEVFAVNYGLYDPIPADMAPGDDYDGDGSSNIAELQLGRDASSNADVGDTTALEDFVAEEMSQRGVFGVLENNGSISEPNRIAPRDDYDSDGVSNIAELQLGRNPMLALDANTTTGLAGFVAEVFAVTYGLYDPIPGNMAPLDDYDSDGASNIAELQLGRNPTSNVDANTTTALEGFIAEAFAVDYDLYDPMPADLAPLDDYDNDGASNIAELQLGRNPSSNVDAATTTAFEDFVAEAFALNYGVYDPMPTNIAPFDDYDSDGTSNIAELQLGRDPSSNVDAGSTSELEDYVAEEMSLLGVYGMPVPANIGPDDDYDSDGMSNISELQLGSDPTDVGDVAAASASEAAMAGLFAETGVIVGELYNGAIVTVADLASDADFDGDGDSNLMEWALGGDLVEAGAQSIALSTQIIGSDFIVTYVRLIAAEQPANLEITAECVLLLTDPWAAVPALGSTESLNVDQSGLPSADYERIDLTIDTTQIDCPFVRVSVTELP